MPTSAPRKGYAIGELSNRTGVKIETIRYYERIGVMPEPGRTAGGNRQYDHEQLKRLFFIRRCRGLGFSLDEIRALLKIVDEHDFTCSDVHEMTITHLVNVKKKLADLRRLERDLKKMASECSAGDMPNCPIIDTLFEAG